MAVASPEILPVGPGARGRAGGRAFNVGRALLVEGEGSGPLGYYPFGNGSGSVPSSPGAVQYDRDATPSPAGRRVTPGSLTPRSGADSPASGFLTPGLAGLARLHGALLERGYVRAPLEDLQALVGLLSLPLEAAVAPAAGPGESPLAAQ